jgi:5'-3' exonuclease
MIFCFDLGEPKRIKAFKGYKEKRNKKKKEFTEHEKAAYANLQKQIRLIRKDYLKRMGYKNVYAKKGYEADDLIARVAQNIGSNRAVIVSSDEDMYQLITKRISVYNPRTKIEWTKKRFKKVYGIKPTQWIKVKAMAGCGSDEIPGIAGIGETSALRFLKGELKPNSKYYHLITCKAGRKTYKKTLPLVRLPYDGTPKLKIRKDKHIEWRPIIRELGMTTLGKRMEYRER